MSLALGEDSFVTLAEADAYFADRLEADTWAAYKDQKKEASLRGAFDRITASCICDFAEPYTPEDAPPIIKKAQLEWATGLSKAEEVDELSETDLSALKAGPVELKFIKTDSGGNQGLNNFIKSMLKNGGCACDFDPEAATSGESSNGTVIF